MDAVKSLADWKAASPEQWLTAANRHLPPVVTIVLVVALAYKLAEITWLMLPGAPVAGPAPVVAPPVSGTAVSTPRPGADYSGLIDSQLFGRALESAAPPPPAVVDAPETNLSLRLTGVIAYGDDDLGHAVIQSGRNVERLYVVGQTIEGASGATLHRVYEDRVLLNRSGTLETLRLPKELSNTPPPAMARPAPAMQMPVADPIAGGSLREVISANATRFSDILRAAPHIEGGRMIGFRINPGRDRELFASLGLQPGDVVTDVNGIVLDDQSRSIQLFESLGESTIANVTIIRDGAPQVLVLDTSQLENVADGLQ
jgi:general secretion pathway protein C